MVANGANLGSVLADNDVATVSALPDSIAILREYFLLVYIAKQLAVTLFVSLFDCANHAEFSLVNCSDLLKSNKIELDTGEFLQLNPATHHTDGFFAAVLQKSSS